MIISQTPFRISMFGGSTDYGNYYKQHGSLLIGFAIDKYCYTNVRWTPGILDYNTKICYAKTELVDNNKDVRHNGVRGVLEFLKIRQGVEIVHLSDLPSQTGIGSSSSFIVGLLNSFYSLSGEPVSKKRLAKEAIYIERELLGEAGGIQDQIWASYGGFNSLSLREDDFEVKPMPVSEEFQQEFFDRAILIYTGKTRKSFDIAESHKNSDNIEAKHRIKEFAHRAYDCFLNSDIESIAGLLHSSWLEKKKVSELVSNYEVDQMYSHLQDDGMVGGKLIGSGGSGFIFGLLDSPKNKSALRRKYQSNFIEFGVDDCGSRIINQ